MFEDSILPPRVFPLNVLGAHPGGHVQGFPLGHVKNYSYNFEEPALYLCIFCLFAVTGGGPFSIDSLIQNKDE